VSTPKDTPQTAEAAALAEQAAASVGLGDAAAAQAAAAAEMAGAERGPVLPAESEMDAFMARMQAQFDEMAKTIDTLKAQQADALRAQGEPYAVRYANGAADKLAAVIAAHPDAPQGHFAGVLADAGRLAEQAAAIVKGTGALPELETAADAVVRFITRGHARGWNKHVDWSAILDDVETAVEEARKIAA